MHAEPRVTRAFSEARAVLIAERIPHCFIGAFAAVAWGRPRATTDVDLVVLTDEQDFARLHARLSEHFDRGRDVGPSDPTEALPDIAVYWSKSEPAVRLDVFVAKTVFEQEVVRLARSEKILGQIARIAAPEACIIYKLIAMRPKDIEDVEGIFEARRAAGAALDWAFLRRWAAEWEVSATLESFAERFE